MKFKKGDRVKMVRKNDEGTATRGHLGETGVILSFGNDSNDEYAKVKWDEGNDTFGCVPCLKNLELLTPEIEVGDEVEIIDNGSLNREFAGTCVGDKAILEGVTCGDSVMIRLRCGETQMILKSELKLLRKKAEIEKENGLTGQHFSGIVVDDI